MKIKNLLRNPTFSGLVLVAVTFMALICANTVWRDEYNHALHTQILWNKTVHFWINDILMTLFFLLVGMEIKRELVIGELSDKAKALQPIFAAIGGVCVPIICFLAINWGQAETLRGWAIPCATDIAFALGVLALLGSRVPPAITILLAAIAIIDDLIAILVIALFYTQDLQPVFLLWGLLAILVLVVMSRRQVHFIPAYLLAGALIWLSFYKAGLHPTLAGVVTALAMPVTMVEKSQIKAPLLRLEHGLYPWVAFLIIPLFAFANAGLSLGETRWTDFTQPLTLGIMLGLVIGKPLGIMLGLYAGHLSGWARKPEQFSWIHYIGMAVLCGIGFTMSLFIGDLGFQDDIYRQQLKLGVLAASLLMAVTGWFLCRITLKTSRGHTR